MPLLGGYNSDITSTSSTRLRSKCCYRADYYSIFFTDICIISNCGQNHFECWRIHPAYVYLGGKPIKRGCTVSYQFVSTKLDLHKSVIALLVRDDCIAFKPIAVEVMANLASQCISIDP